MGVGGDAVDRVFALILSDDRRKLQELEEQAGKALWRKVFAAVQERALYEAVLTWLSENKRGRPNIAEVKEILERARLSREGPTGSPEKHRYTDSDLRWSVSVLRDPFRFSESYRHTLEMAEHVLRARGFQDWRGAMSHLEPGWSPATVTEVLL